MRKHRKSALLAGVAAGVVGLGLSGPAMAFDKVYWDWEKLVSENIAIDGQINLDLNPTGLVELEKMQVFIGDASANSEVANIDNIQPTSGSNGGTVSFTVDWSGKGDQSTDPSQFGTGITGGLPGQEVVGPTATLGGDLNGSGTLFGTYDEGSQDITLSASFNDVSVPAISASDTYVADTELPEIVSAATAAGNNQSITSDVGVMLHDAQFVFGGFSGDVTSGNLGQAASVLPTADNTSLSAVLAFAAAGATGVITPATIDATSSVHDITNASIDSNATAVANNANIEVAAVTPDDASMIADYMQGAYADVSAGSTVYNVSLNHYTGLGSLGKPIVNSVATAVGNNLSIKVTSPTGP